VHRRSSFIWDEQSGAVGISKNNYPCGKRSDLGPVLTEVSNPTQWRELAVAVNDILRHWLCHWC
jgi:hypothetical protein